MALKGNKRIRSVALFGLGVVLGATGGPVVYRKLHPPLRQRPDMRDHPGSASFAPPELPPEGIQEPTPDDPGAPVPPGPGKVEHPEPTVPEIVTAMPPRGPEFFGFSVGSNDRAPDPVREPKPAPKPAPAPKLVRLRLMKGRCVGGFDGTSPVLDFSGWTRSIVGELTYETGRLAETARGLVTADPATLDTGDAARDKEIREKILETAKFPQMSFEVGVIGMTGLDTMNMSGTMEIHGVRKQVTIPCSIRVRRDGYAWMKGEIRLNMTDFGIDPPVKMGIIKVRDEIRIWFEIWAEPVKELK
ncbi:MAG: YceI family protein [Planctomycetota bacterium]